VKLHRPEGDNFMALRLNWVASAGASCFYAVARTAAGRVSVLPDVTSALAAATENLNAFLTSQGIAAAAFFDHLVPLAVANEANRELARLALTKTAGRDRAALLAEQTAGLLTDCEQAYFRACPGLLDELELRHRPLRELWEARGPGLLTTVGRLTDRRLVVDEATVAVVQPLGGGGGGSHAAYNLATIEAMLTNPLEQLPETVRLAWLLSVLNADLPEFVELLGPGRGPTVVTLAMLPAVLESAVEVELVRPDDGLLATAAAAWQAPLPDGDRSLEIVRKWWTFTRLAGAPWNVALTALDSLLYETCA